MVSIIVRIDFIVRSAAASAPAAAALASRVVPSPEQSLDVIGRGVDAVKRVEHRPQCLTERDVVAVRFQYSSFALGGRSRRNRLCDRVFAMSMVCLASWPPRMRDGAHLSHQRTHLRHRVDGRLHVVAWVSMSFMFLCMYDRFIF